MVLVLRFILTIVVVAAAFTVPVRHSFLIPLSAIIRLVAGEDTFVQGLTADMVAEFVVAQQYWLTARFGTTPLAAEAAAMTMLRAVTGEAAGAYLAPWQI
jgi:hypothetical protein